MNLNSKHLAATLALTLLGAGAANAACTYPRGPDALPDGETATKEQMIAGKKEVTRYNDEMTVYLDCIKAESDAQRKQLEQESQAATSDAEKKAVAVRKDEFEKKHTQKHNAAVDEVTAVVDRFNEQLRAYKKKTGG